MGQVQCSGYVSNNCQITEWEGLRNIQNPPRNDWGLEVHSILGLACYCFLWCLTFRIKYKDFTRAYMICQLIPLTLGATIQFIINIFYKTGQLDAPSTQFVVTTSVPTNFLNFLYKFTKMAINLNEPSGTARLMMLHIIAARTRIPMKQSRIWIPFIFCLCSASLVGLIHTISLSTAGSVNNMIDRYYNNLSSLLHSLYGIATFVAWCAMCCCIRPFRGQSQEPYIVNAGSRLCWAGLPFVFFAFNPSSGRYCFSLLASYTAYYGFSDALLKGMGTIYMDLAVYCDLYEPYFFTICVILFLPTYRSTLFGKQGNQSQIIRKDTEAPQMIFVPRNSFIQPGAPVAYSNGENVILTTVPINAVIYKPSPAEQALYQPPPAVIYA